MQPILANCSASISELKRNPTALLNEAEGNPIAILNHNRPTAYLIPASVYEELMDKLDDCKLAKTIKDRECEKHLAMEVNLDEL